jgi:hypothetical protein
MHGPPRDCKGKAEGEKTSLRKCIRPLLENQFGHDARACPSKSVGGSFETILEVEDTPL